MLISQEFKATMESILEAFNSLQDELNKERQRMELSWKRRTKQHEKALSSCVELYGSIKSISEESIPTIKMLEFPKAS